MSQRSEEGVSERGGDASTDMSASTPPEAAGSTAALETGLPGFRALDERAIEKVEAVGVDSGATLVKLCVRDASRRDPFRDLALAFDRARAGLARAPRPAIGSA